MQYARLNWSELGEPYSPDYRDIYFSCGDGLEESRYVFLANNGLPQRWRERERFVIGETGFGTGLNFLATWALWRAEGGGCRRLHFVSVEKYPLHPDDLARAHRRWPELAGLSAELRRLYPPPLPGCHRLPLEGGRVLLDLIYGDAVEQLGRLSFQADAWYLDGFDPRANPEMWHADLFRQLARLGRPGTTLGTFTVAGAVRRGLAEAGFAVEKIPGHGRKRQMLRGRLERPAAPLPVPPWFRPPPPPTTTAGERAALVIGAGLAGAAAAAALARRGWRVTVLEREAGPAAGASGNHVGLAYPFLTADGSPQGRFLSEGQRYTLALLRQLSAAGRGIDWRRCGVVQLAANPRLEKRQRALLERLQPPPETLRPVTAAEAAALVGLPLAVGGLHYPDGVWLHPPDLCRALLEEAGIEARYGVPVAELERRDGRWCALDGEGRELAAAPLAIIAAGHLAGRFRQSAGLPLKPVRGQVSHLPADGESGRMGAALSYEGYLTPPRRGLHCLGATFEPGDPDPLPRLDGHRENLEGLRPWLPGLAGRQRAEALTGRVSFRCASPDKLPQVGPLPDLAAWRRDYGDLHYGRHWREYPPGRCFEGLYLSAGHGARGLSSAPLAGELLASLIAGDPPPLEAELIQALHPGRYLIRELKRG